VLLSSLRRPHGPSLKRTLGHRARHRGTERRTGRSSVQLPSAAWRLNAGHQMAVVKPLCGVVDPMPRSAPGPAARAALCTPNFCRAAHTESPTHTAHTVPCSIAVRAPQSDRVQAGEPPRRARCLNSHRAITVQQRHRQHGASYPLAQSCKPTVAAAASTRLEGRADKYAPGCRRKCSMSGLAALAQSHGRQQQLHRRQALYLIAHKGVGVGP
jgi:hypothetical protein